MMKNIKQHIIRINVKGRYLLYAGSPDWGFEEQALDVSSNQVPQSYLLAQKRLDNILKTGKLSWSMSFRHDALNQNPIVSYGSFIDAPDDKGRSGISFIHAIEVNNPNSILPCVHSIITLLSHNNIRILTQTLADVAVGKKDVDELLKFVSRSVEEKMIYETNIADSCYKNRKLKLSGIKHDCAGAAAVAWLTMACQQNNVSPPWEVYDMVDSEGDIQTRVTNSNYNQTILASSILSGDVKQYLDSILLSKQQEPSYRPPIENLAEKGPHEMLPKQEKTPEDSPSKPKIPDEEYSRGRLTNVLLFLLVILSLTIVIMLFQQSRMIKRLEQRDRESEQKPPDNRRAVTIEYYARDIDRQKVKSALKELSFTLDIKQTKYPEIPINYIRFGSNVNIDDVKLVVCTLLDADFQIKSILPFINSSGSKASLIQIGGE